MARGMFLLSKECSFVGKCSLCQRNVCCQKNVPVVREIRLLSDHIECSELRDRN